MKPFDLDAYLARIAHPRPSTPSIEAVASVMRAHMAAIPFENLDVLLGRGIRLDLDRVVAKLVTARRGGYCFEHGTLFLAALAALGVPAVAHAARVLLMTPKAHAPRTHMFLTVRLDGRTWMLDPGFGGHGPLVPVPLAEGDEAREGPDVHRMVRHDGEWVLEALVNGSMTPLRTSSLEPQQPIDFVLANHYVSTYPDSPFVQRLMIRALTSDGRVSAMNRDVSRLRDGVLERRQLANRAELRTLLATHFGFDMPEVESLDIPSVTDW
jgi:N-hydroxyarylamine O-acetyltransferase